jgi:hypothetical protein
MTNTEEFSFNSPLYQSYSKRDVWRAGEGFQGTRRVAKRVIVRQDVVQPLSNAVLHEWRSDVPNLYRHRSFGLVGGEIFGNVLYTLDCRPV